jgi:hypothetical protein
MNDFLSKLPALMSALSKAIFQAVMIQLIEISRIARDISIFLKERFVQFVKWLWLFYCGLEVSILSLCIDIALSVYALRQLLFIILVGIIFIYFKLWILLFIYIVVIVFSIRRFFGLIKKV